MNFDRRITPARPDLAAAHLKGVVEAERYVEGARHRIRFPSTPVKRVPRPDAPLETEALLGEAVTVYDIDEEGWAWGQLERDGYVGWFSADALGPDEPAPTHRVIAPRSHFYPIAGFKAEPLGAVAMGAMVLVTRIDGRYAATPQGFIRTSHLMPMDEAEPDFVAVAERLIGTPYIWGGKSGAGLDCSGLVQLSMQLAGQDAPRDSDMQAAGLGDALPTGVNGLRRGDLVFWKGHVGIMQDEAQLLHANVHHMAVASEPLKQALLRIEAGGDGAPTGFRRPRHRDT